MQHLKQDKENNCGQTCVAMIAGISIEESEKVFGHSCSTRTREVVKALRKLGFEPQTDNLVRSKWGNTPDALAILKMTFNEKQRSGHWVVSYYGWIYDSAQKEKHPYWHYCNFMKEFLRPTSYLKIGGKYFHGKDIQFYHRGKKIGGE